MITSYIVISPTDTDLQIDSLPVLIYHTGAGTTLVIAVDELLGYKTSIKLVVDIDDIDATYLALSHDNTIVFKLDSNPLLCGTTIGDHGYRTILDDNPKLIEAIVQAKRKVNNQVI